MAVVVLIFGQTVVSAQSQKFSVSSVTPDCRNGNRAVHEVCLPEGQRIATAPIVKITSQAGSSSVDRSQPSPGKPNCWQITTTVEPNGEDCLNIPFKGQVCNCKGRGWINLDVVLTPATQ